MHAEANRATPERNEPNDAMKPEQCQFCETHPTLPRCTKLPTRKWGDVWLCEEHGKREKAPSPQPTDAMNEEQIIQRLESLQWPGAFAIAAICACFAVILGAILKEMSK